MTWVQRGGCTHWRYWLEARDCLIRTYRVGNQFKYVQARTRTVIMTFTSTITSSDSDQF
jgi:hypothetical protein